jgi:hypothetical protein
MFLIETYYYTFVQSVCDCGIEGGFQSLPTVLPEIE